MTYLYKMRYVFLFLLFALALPNLSAQQIVQEQAGPGLQLAPLAISLNVPPPPLLHLNKLTNHSTKVNFRQPRPAPKAYSYEKLSLFCKWEVRMEKKAGIPIRVRLGDVQTVDRLEGKN